MRHKTALPHILVFASLILAACSAPAQPAAPAATTAPEAAAATAAPAAVEAPASQPSAGGKSVTIGFQQEPSALSSYFSSQTFASWASAMFNVGLWNYGENDEEILELAAEVPSVANGGVSADGKTITYKLKPGLKWSDGQPLTSADMKFTWEQIMRPENTGITSRNGWDRIESIETPDETTAIVKFSEVYAPWKLLWSGNGGGFMPMHVLKDLPTLDGSDWVLNGTVGHGPFKVKQVVKGDRIEFEANDLYWRGRPKLDTVFIKIVPDRDAVLAGLRAGDLDLGTDFVESNIPDLEGLSDTLVSYLKPAPYFEHYFFNLGEKDTWPQDEALFDKICPFKDVRVRQAITYAIDRFTIVDKLLFGKTKVIAGLWPNSQFEDPSLEPYPYDPEKAKALLDEAGYKPGPDGIRVGQCNGKEVRLDFKHSTTTPNQLRANVQALVQQNLADVGIGFTPDNVSSDVLFDTFANNGKLATGNYEMGGFTTQFVVGGDPDPGDYFKSSGISYKKPDGSINEGGNSYRLVDKELEDLSNEQASVADPEKRKEIIQKMQRIMYEKAYVIPMYARLDINVGSKRLTGVKMSPSSNSFWNVHEWDVVQ